MIFLYMVIKIFTKNNYMVQNAQVTPFTDAIIGMEQGEAEKLLFWNEDFWVIKKYVQSILEEVENLSDWEVKEEKKKALLRKVAELPNNIKWTIFTAMRYVSSNDEDRKKTALIAKTRYERFLASSKWDESQQKTVWKVYNNLGHIEKELWNNDQARENWWKVPEEAGETYYKASFSHGKLLFDEWYSEMAREHWDKIPETSPIFTLVCLRRGKLAYMKWDYETAKAEFWKVQAQNEWNNKLFHYARYQLWSIAFDEQNFEEAIRYMLEAKDFWDRNFILWYSYFLLWSGAEAIPFLERVTASEKSNDFTYALSALTSIYVQKLEQWEEAEQQVIAYGESFLESYQSETEEIQETFKEMYFLVNTVLWSIYIDRNIDHQKAKTYLENVTQQAGAELYWKAQRNLWYIEWFKDWKDNS